MAQVGLPYKQQCWPDLWSNKTMWDDSIELVQTGWIPPLPVSYCTCIKQLRWPSGKSSEGCQRGFATWKIRHRRFATKKICHTTNVTENLSVSVWQMFATVPMWKIRHTTVIGWGRRGGWVGRVGVRGLRSGSWVGPRGKRVGGGGLGLINVGVSNSPTPTAPTPTPGPTHWPNPPAQPPDPTPWLQPP